MAALHTPLRAAGHLGQALRTDRNDPNRVADARRDLTASKIGKAIDDYGAELREHGLWLTPEHVGLLFIQLQRWTER